MYKRKENIIDILQQSIY